MPAKLFQVEILGVTMIVTPVINLSELEAAQVETESRDLIRRFEAEGCRSVVIDYNHTDYFGSDALYMLVRLGKEVRLRNGYMALCNVSMHEREILRISRMDSMWPMFDGRSEAIDAAQKNAPVAAG